MLEILVAIINNPSALGAIAVLLLTPVIVLFFVFKEFFKRYDKLQDKLDSLEDKLDKLIISQNLLEDRVKIFFDIITSKIK